MQSALLSYDNPSLQARLLEHWTVALVISCPQIDFWRLVIFGIESKLLTSSILAALSLFDLEVCSWHPDDQFISTVLVSRLSIACL